MGLTGVVVSATLSCIRVEMSYAVVETERCRDLDPLMERLEQGDDPSLPIPWRGSTRWRAGPGWAAPC